MAFDSVIRQFRTVPEFIAYLATLPLPDWGVVGSTFHNTFIPNTSQWAGTRTMLSMRSEYVKKGWSAGPHFYLACHSPNPDHNGIWQLTPPTHEGVHAGPCNGSRFGIEVVGDFQTTPPTVEQRSLLVEIVAHLHRWALIGPDLLAHRDCMPGRTCPGNAGYAALPSIREDLERRMSILVAKTTLADLWGTRADYHPEWAIPREWAKRAAELGPAQSGELYIPDAPYSLQYFARGIGIYNKTKDRAIVRSFAEMGIA